MVKIKINLLNMTVLPVNDNKIESFSSIKTSTPNCPKKQTEPILQIKKDIKKPRICVPTNFFLKKAIKNTQKFDLDDMLYISNYFEVPKMLSPIRETQDEKKPIKKLAPIKKTPKTLTRRSLPDLKNLVTSPKPLDESFSFLSTPKKLRKSIKIHNLNEKGLERLIDSKLKRLIDNYAINVENLVMEIEREKNEIQRMEIKA